MTGEPSATAPGPDGAPGSEPATVLVVDDTTIPRVALARGVEREGHRVLQAADGREALRVLAEQPVDMVLLDLVMPDLDGFGVLEAMRADPALRRIPVLVVSASEATEDVARAIGMGAIDCLPKPFEPALLRVRLRTALEQQRLRRLEQDYLRQELALRQQERLAMLGRLSAGLGHELNNPAAAALASSRRLREAVVRADELMPMIAADPHCSELVAAATAALGYQDGPGAPGAGRPQSERVDAVEAALAARGVPEAWRLADELAGAGLDGDVVERALDTPADPVLATEWLRVRAEVRAAVWRIATSVERMAGLTSALRRYSYLDRAPQQDVDVRTGIEDTLTILAHKVPAGVRIERDLGERVPRIEAYGGQLNQVWTNLVDNALDAVGDEGRITVRVRPAAGGVEVVVADDGGGIAPELLADVFDPFVTTKPPGQGTGLGLNVAHQIVTDVHGGRLTVQSAPGRTAFTVWLPLRSPERSPKEADGSPPDP
ncbi:ATP-binding protein [Nocardioides sp. YIM 152588]|uniref:sensor histidine kinase n=1 Tax=Nocardioides sp. YIM 152588 TaxID=3158259 RepID=UPI0032E3C221